MQIDVWFDTRDADRVRPLLDALRTTGITLERAGDTPPAPVLAALITENAVEEPTASTLVELANHYQDVVPVSFLPGAAPIFANLSQSLYSQLGPEECARRIATIARYGGATIVAWNDLAARAAAFASGTERGLLAEPDLPEARNLLRTELAAESGRRAEVQAYIDASAAAVTRRKRIGAGALAGAAFALTVLLVFSTVQAFSANTARGQAIDSGNRATADRLGRIVTQLADGDPDLPTILAARAVAAAPTQAALAAVLTAASHTWPHRSYELGYRPMNVSSASDADMLAVTDAQNQRLVMYTEQGTKRGAEIPYSTTATGAEGFVSPDGKRVTLETTEDGSLAVYTTEGQRTGKVDGAAHLAGWADATHLVVYRDDVVSLVDVDSGEAKPIGTVPAGSRISGADVSFNGQFAVITAGDNTRVFEVATGRLVGSGPAISGNVSVSDDGTTALGAVDQMPVSEDVTRSPSTPVAYNRNGTRLIDIAGGFYVSGGTDGNLTVFRSGSPEVRQTITAHLSDSVRMTRMPEGRLATIGLDGYLRVWDVPGAQRFGLPASNLGELDANRLGAATLSGGIAIDPRLSARNQIRYTPDGRIAVTMRPGYATIVTGVSEKPGPHRAFAGLYADIMLSADGSKLASVAKYPQIAELERGAGWRTILRPKGTPPKMADADGLRGVATVVDDGRASAVADESTVGVLRESDPRTAKYDSPAVPVGMTATGGRATVITADGTIRSSDGGETPLRAAGGGPGPRIAAAEFTDATRAVGVTEDGMLIDIDIDARVVRPIGSLRFGGPAYNVRIGAKGRLIAVIGADGVEVFDRRADRPVFTEGASGTYRVSDVAIAPDGADMYAVTPRATIRKIDLRSESTPTPPRSLTKIERGLYELDD